MHKAITIIPMVLIVLFVRGLNGFAQQRKLTSPDKGGLKIGFIKDFSEYEGNAGCTLRLPQDDKKDRKNFIFLSDYDDNAVVNVDGKDVNLKLKVRKEPKGEDLKVGQKSEEDYTGTGVKVHVDYVTTWVCPPDDESCEVTSFNAIVIVTRGNSRKAVRVKGVCGS